MRLTHVKKRRERSQHRQGEVQQLPVESGGWMPGMMHKAKKTGE
jgi:hypothetical protein